MTNQNLRDRNRHLDERAGVPRSANLQSGPGALRRLRDGPTALRTWCLVTFGVLSVAIAVSGEETLRTAVDTGADGVNQRPHSTGEAPDEGEGRSLPPFAKRCEHSKLNTEDADPLGRGVWQLQLNYSFSHLTQNWGDSWKSRPWSEAEEHSLGLAVVYGVNDTLDLGVAAGYAWLRDEEESEPDSGDGPSDISISAKWRFLEAQETTLGFAYIPTITIPAGQESDSDELGPGQGFWSFDNRLACVKDWTPRWSSNFDIGFELPLEHRRDLHAGFSTNLAIGYRLADWLQPEVELGYSHDFVDDGKDANLTSLTGGIVAPISDRLCLRFGIQQDLAGQNTDEVTAALFSVDFHL